MILKALCGLMSAYDPSTSTHIHTTHTNTRRIPHPLKHEMLIRVQTDGSSHQNIQSQQLEVWGPVKAVKHALDTLHSEFQDMLNEFEKVRASCLLACSVTLRCCKTYLKSNMRCG